MIKIEELNPKKFPVTEEEAANLEKLLNVMNKVRAAYNKPMIVSSGFRSKADHIRIYTKKGIPEDKIPMGSQHLRGNAVDISDPKGELYKWCEQNVELLKSFGVKAIEKDTKGWVHFQIVPVKSGNFFFNP